MEKLKYDLTDFLKKEGRFALVVFLKDDDYVIKYEYGKGEVTVYTISEFATLKKDSLILYVVSDLGIRRCSKCGKLMIEGFLVDDGLEYYCSDDCVFSTYTKEECFEMYMEGHAFWTNWGTEVITFITPIFELGPIKSKNDCSIKCDFENDNEHNYCKKWTVALEDNPNNKLGCIASFYDERGQFVSSYYVDTLLYDHNDGSGLALYLDCPYWTISGSDLKIILKWIKTKTRMCLAV